MNRFVIACPSSQLVLLTDVKVHTEFLEQVANTFVSVHCPACGVSHTMRLWPCKPYRIKRQAGELQEAS
jgi:hypothetical protein